MDETAILNAQPLPYIFRDIKASCSKTVCVARKCGHKTSGIPCVQLPGILETKKLPPCETLISLERACGHSYETLCHLRDEPLPLCEAPVDELFQYPCGKNGHIVRPGTCLRLEELRANGDVKCPVEVSCVRARCGPKTKVECHLQKDVTSLSTGAGLVSESGAVVVDATEEYGEESTKVPDCVELVKFRRTCGHEKSVVPCARAFRWAVSPENTPPCLREVEIESPLCGHPIRVPCNSAASVTAVNAWK